MQSSILCAVLAMAAANAQSPTPTPSPNPKPNPYNPAYSAAYVEAAELAELIESVEQTPTTHRRPTPHGTPHAPTMPLSATTPIGGLDPYSPLPSAVTKRFVVDLSLSDLNSTSQLFLTYVTTATTSGHIEVQPGGTIVFDGPGTGTPLTLTNPVLAAPYAPTNMSPMSTTRSAPTPTMSPVQ